MASAAEMARLTGSLIDRNAVRDRVERVLAPPPIATAEAARADAPLFVAKGEARVSPLAPAAPANAHRPRLWLRLSAAERRRINLAAAFLGQSTAAFLRDALTAFMANLLPLEPAPVSHARRRPQLSREQRVKLAFRVDAAVHGAVHSAAGRRGDSVQALLTSAIEAHLARFIDSPAATNLCLLLAAFDAVTAERRASGGAEVIDFPRRPAAAPPPLERRRAAR